MFEKSIEKNIRYLGGYCEEINAVFQLKTSEFDRTSKINRFVATFQKNLKNSVNRKVQTRLNSLFIRVHRQA